MERSEFLSRLTAELPEVLAQISECDIGLLHCEVAVFRRATESAMDAGRLWGSERHFRLVEELLRVANPELRNALEVSYMQDLALGECTPQRHRAVRERMPEVLREILIRCHEQWK